MLIYAPAKKEKKTVKKKKKKRQANGLGKRGRTSHIESKLACTLQGTLKMKRT